MCKVELAVLTETMIALAKAKKETMLLHGGYGRIRRGTGKG